MSITIILCTMANARNMSIKCASGEVFTVKDIALQPHRSTINTLKDLIVYGYYDVATGTNMDNCKKTKIEKQAKVRVSLSQVSIDHAVAVLKSNELANIAESTALAMPSYVAHGTVSIKHMTKRGVINETVFTGQCTLHCVVSTFVNGHTLEKELAAARDIASVKALTLKRFALIDIAEDGACVSAPSTWLGSKSVYADVAADDGTRPTIQSLPHTCPPSEFVVWRILVHLAASTCCDAGVRAFYSSSMFVRDGDSDVFNPVSDFLSLTQPGLAFFSHHNHKTNLRTAHEVQNKLDILASREPPADLLCAQYRNFFLHAGYNLIAPLVAATNANKFLWLDASPFNILLQ